MFSLLLWTMYLLEDCDNDIHLYILYNTYVYIFYIVGIQQKFCEYINGQAFSVPQN